MFGNANLKKFDINLQSWINNRNIFFAFIKKQKMKLLKTAPGEKKIRAELLPLHTHTLPEYFMYEKKKCFTDCKKYVKNFYLRNSWTWRISLNKPMNHGCVQIIWTWRKCSLHVAVLVIYWQLSGKEWEFDPISTSWG